MIDSDRISLILEDVQLALSKHKASKFEGTLIAAELLAIGAFQAKSGFQEQALEEAFDYARKVLSSGCLERVVQN
jgi:hypothetical protein